MSLPQNLRRKPVAHRPVIWRRGLTQYLRAKAAESLYTACGQRCET
jgi:hypothetical protein